MQGQVGGGDEVGFFFAGGGGSGHVSLFLGVVGVVTGENGGMGMRR